MNSPQRKSLDPFTYDLTKDQFSTAEKLQNFEQSQQRYQQLVQENIWLKKQIEQSRYQHPVAHQCSNCNQSQNTTYEQPAKNRDWVLRNMLQRNKYLEQKTNKLKRQYQRQTHSISSIKHSQKWKNRFTCIPQTNSCYEDRYLQLLRVRSPFY